jgi:CTP synthase (UTP-ammonia lyase)
MRTIRIALIGDRSEEVAAHGAIPRALSLAAEATGAGVEAEWFATDRLEKLGPELIARHDAIWCVPGSPYASLEGALSAIRLARERLRPFLGTCGGFQHAMIEFARHELGLADADHAESNPQAAVPVISQLSCPLVERPGSIRLAPESRLARIFGAAEIVESYHCRFGPDPSYEALFENSRMRFVGRDPSGAVRAFELEGHPFFFGTLFQPERSAWRGERHPLIAAFLEAAQSSGKS